MYKVVNRFWKWYERHETFNLGLAAFLFSLQIVHLIWLAVDVVAVKMFGETGFHIHPTGIFSILILLVDYLEIPAIVATSLVYINELRIKFNYKSLLFLIFINSQWIHLFWITDEFVVDAFLGTTTTTHLPEFLAWIAILIDYLELPVIYDTMKKFINALKKEGLTSALEELKEE